MTERPSTSPLTYSDAGVSIANSEKAVSSIRDLVRSTNRPEVLSDIGSFGGLFALGQYQEPVLVSSTDGVGTKLKVAFLANQHDTVGYDLVAHCGNDIVVQGAEPLFFLDYVGTGCLDPVTFQRIVKGLVDGCREIGATLIGGETAEMPGFYHNGEYDLVGTIVGVVERGEIITGDLIRAGDHIIGLPASGLHTNGYSLARRILFDHCGYTVDDYLPELSTTIGQELLKNHQSYVKIVLNLKSQLQINGVAHITGGGLPDNVVRILPDNCRAVIETSSWQTPVIFSYLQERGGVLTEEMYRVFNMGIGLVIIVPPANSEKILQIANKSVLIGQIEHGPKGVELA